MIDTAQLLLITAITLMTILGLVLGVQLFFIFKDFRRLLQQSNEIVEEFRKVGTNIGSGYTEILGFFSGLKKLFFIVDLLAKKKKGRKN